MWCMGEVCGARRVKRDGGWKTERGRYKTGVGGIREMERERGELRGSTLQRYPNQRWRISVEREEERDKKERKKGRRNKRGEGR